jgi:hypothetical protein
MGTLIDSENEKYQLFQHGRIFCEGQVPLCRKTLQLLENDRSWIPALKELNP